MRKGCEHDAGRNNLKPSTSWDNDMINQPKEIQEEYMVRIEGFLLL